MTAPHWLKNAVRLSWVVVRVVGKPSTYTVRSSYASAGACTYGTRRHTAAPSGDSASSGDVSTAAASAATLTPGKAATRGNAATAASGT